MLDARVAALGGQGLGRRLDPAHRPGGDRRLSGRRSRPADHHRPRLQRRADAAVSAACGGRDQRHQVQHPQGHAATTRCRWTTPPARRRSPSTPSTTWTPRSSTTTRRPSQQPTIKVDGTHTETIKKDTKITDHRAPTTTTSWPTRPRTTCKGRLTRTTTPRRRPRSRTTSITSTSGPSPCPPRLYIDAAQRDPAPRRRQQIMDGQRRAASRSKASTSRSRARRPSTIKGGIVHSEADSEHQTKGAIVLSEGSATNTVKGGMVMLNP